MSSSLARLHKLVRFHKPKYTSRWLYERLMFLLESDLVSGGFWDTVSCCWLDSMVHRKPKGWVGSFSAPRSVPQSQTSLLTPSQPSQSDCPESKDIPQRGIEKFSFCEEKTILENQFSMSIITPTFEHLRWASHCDFTRGRIIIWSINLGVSFPAFCPF